MDKLKVLVVDDSIVYRKILTAAVELTGLATAAQTAANGIQALEKLGQPVFDVVLLDVNMPELDGIQTLKRIKAKYPPLPVIMVSSTGAKNASVTLETLQAGAMDFIVKPLNENYDQNLKMVSEHLKMLFAQIQVKNTVNQEVKKTGLLKPAPAPTFRTDGIRKTQLTGVDLILIAASTGGPLALEQVLGRMAKGFAKPVLIVQHMPAEFTKVLAEILDRKTPLKVIEGASGEAIRAGQAILAPGGFHMTVQIGPYSNRVVKLDQTEYVQGVRPAADVLFRSVASQYQGGRILAVVLTGMGSDAKAGVAELKAKCQCYCIAQSEKTCVVYGMPRSVVDSGLADEIVEIDCIADRIQEIVQQGS